MTTMLKSTLAAAALVAAGAFPALAAEPSLAIFAANHFNKGVSVADQQTVPGTIAPMSRSGITLMTRGPVTGSTLAEQAAIHFNAGVAVPDRQPIAAPASGSAALAAYAATHFNRGVAVQDRQTERF